MKISKSSYHYKISKIFFTPYSNTSLCNYFWNVIFSIILLPILFVLFIPVSFIVFHICKLFNVNDLKTDKNTYKEKLEGLYEESEGFLSIFIGIILCAIVAILSFIIYGIVDFSWKNQASIVDMIILTCLVIVLSCVYILSVLRKRNKRVSIKHENIFLAYFKAKKKKICPIIEWKD